MQQAGDFLAETVALHGVLADLTDAGFNRETAFKSWTVNQILQHLHFFNRMAILSLTEPDRFSKAYAEFAAGYRADGSMLSITDQLLDGLCGPELRATWHETAQETAAAFAQADPKARVKWAGPDMSARSSITARLMETWAHGQAIYDVLGLGRVDHDRIRNIAHLGVSTYGWTFRNRGEVVPEPIPYIRLQAPSGAVWEWGESSTEERIEGPATAFCQIVTQTRNVADVEITVTGTNATRWMALAQCFAGKPNDPPKPGTRYRAAQRCIT